MIGARMHACLNALSLGVSTIPMAYSDKFRSLFADLGYPPGIDLRTIGSSPVGARELLAAAPTAEETRRAREEGAFRAAQFIASLHQLDV